MHWIRMHAQAAAKRNGHFARLVGKTGGRRAL
jgi:hypothetical protein